METGNTLGTARSVVRQSRRFRENESGNAMKDLLGAENLKWDTQNKQGVFEGQPAHADEGHPPAAAPAAAAKSAAKVPGCAYAVGDQVVYTAGNGTTQLVTVSMVSWEGVNVAAGEEPMIAVRMPDGNVRDTVMKRLCPAPAPAATEPNTGPDIYCHGRGGVRSHVDAVEASYSSPSWRQPPPLESRSRERRTASGSEYVASDRAPRRVAGRASPSASPSFSSGGRQPARSYSNSSESDYGRGRGGGYGEYDYHSGASRTGSGTGDGRGPPSSGSRPVAAGNRQPAPAPTGRYSTLAVRRRPQRSDAA